MPDTNSSLPVLIVGCGPTGLALACDLARRGVDFRMIDKAAQFFNGSRGKGLQPRSLEVLDDFGVVDEVLRNGRFHLPFRGYDGPKILGERDSHEGQNPTPSTPYASVLIIPQWRVEEILRGLLGRHGREVELSSELVSLEQDEDGVAATVRRPEGDEVVRCRYLVAADGGRSFVRKFLDVPFEGETWKDERMYVGDVRLRGLDREAWHAWPQSPGGLLALCPLPSTDQFQLQAQIVPGEEEEPSLALFQRLVTERTGGMDIELLDASWLSVYRANVRMVSRYRVGRVLLAGDAAHVHSPAGGQGMNTGIQDAYNLGWKLEAVLKGAPDSLLDTYEEERLPVAAQVLGISSKLHKQMIDGGEDRLRRDAATLQLGINYRGMSLSEGESRLKVAAGDRAPDAPGVDLEGKPVRLFDIFRGPKFTLLRLFPGEGAREYLDGDDRVTRVTVLAAISKQGFEGSGERVFADADGHLAEAYGVVDEVCLLVRPDGYVGWVGTFADRAGLVRYLDKFGV